MKTNIDRRTFVAKLNKASVALACLGMGVVSVSGVSPRSGGSLLREEKIDAVAGELYLEKFPEERSVELLVKKIWDKSLEDLETTSQEAIEDVLCNTIRRDFREEQVLSLAGWLVSRSEARFFAIQSILIKGI
ncbi:hypothetical protein MLD52_11550 [Puniceicoccaceae bacterium K14]|nr:hypothetical protein [Puniceicoccaceae bacterium K14]